MTLLVSVLAMWVRSSSAVVIAASIVTASNARWRRLARRRWMRRASLEVEVVGVRDVVDGGLLGGLRHILSVDFGWGSDTERG